MKWIMWTMFLMLITGCSSVQRLCYNGWVVEYNPKNMYVTPLESERIQCTQVSNTFESN